MSSPSIPPSGKTIIDSHAHVVSEYFGDEKEEVIARAFASGVVQMVNPGVVFDNIDELFEIADSHADIYLAVGLHPHDARKWDEKGRALLKESALRPKVVAIGECGLDFYYNNSDRQSQLHAFKEQVSLAIELDKPVIVHCRDAWKEAVEILKDGSESGRRKGRRLKGVFHCFTGDESVLADIADLDFYVSFSGIVTFPNARSLQAAACHVPSDRLLVETDCPFLAPQKVRGKRNEPRYVWHVAEKLAELRGDTLDNIATLTAENARRLFGLPAPF